MGERIRQQSKLLHQRANPVEHRIDLAAKLVEGIVGARHRDPLRQVARADPVGDAGDLADPLADVMGEDQAA